jgi:hypothetical protein
MGRVAEDVGIVADADRRIAARRKTRAGDDDVDRAERQALVDVGFLAELRGGIDLDLVAVVGPFRELARRPDRLRVEGLRRLIDMGPFELCLGVGRQAGGGERGGREQADGPAA